MRPDLRLRIATEVALAMVTLAAVVGMARLFVDGSFLTPLAVQALAAHGIAAALRWRGVKLGLAGVLAAAAAALVIAWGFYLSTTVALVPTGDTWQRATDDVSTGWNTFQDVVAPAPVETGFLVVTAIAIWFAAFIADWAAFRLWVPFEATLPAGTLFVFGALLGDDRWRMPSASLFAATVIAFLLLHRVQRQERTAHWVGGNERRGRGSMLVTGGALGAIAIALAAVSGPSLPGADAQAVVSWRDLTDGPDSRVTVSPLVDIKGRLVEQSDLEVFSVRSDVPAYWRLTSLEAFDGRIWSSSGSYGRAGGTLPESVGADVPFQPIEQVVVINALAAIWLPAAYEARAIATSGAEVRYDETSGTLIVDHQYPTSDGITYTVVSQSPRLDAQTLNGSDANVPGDIATDHLALPGSFSPLVRDVALQATSASNTPFGKARALQDYFRRGDFAYDLTIPAGHSDDVLEDFVLRRKRGYCEQFAGAYAAMARAVGLPSRVAVGFTWGDFDGSTSTYHVTGRHAHAWPEVYLDGAGWVAFEPTPGRGMPFAEPYTGVTPEQAGAGGGQDTEPAPTSSSTTPTTNANGSTTSSTLLRGDLGEAPADPGAANDAGPGWVRIATLLASAVLGLAVLYAVTVAVGHAIRRRMRRAGATTPSNRVELAWTESLEALAPLGLRPRRSDTSWDVAARAGGLVPVAGDAPERLAGHVETTLFAPDEPDEAIADDAERAAHAIVGAARARLSVKQRLVVETDVRPLLPRRTARRRAGTTTSTTGR